MMKDYYEILQVHPKAEPATIKAVYRSLAQKYHPDGSNPDGARMRLINEAYSVLNDPVKRAQYDKSSNNSKPVSPKASRYQPSPSRTAQPRQSPNSQSSQTKAVALTNRAEAKALHGDFLEAVRDCNEAIRLNPQGARGYYVRGLARSCQGDLVGAIRDYTEALRLNPLMADAYVSRAQAYNFRGDYVAAVKDRDEAIRLNPSLQKHFASLPIEWDARRQQRQADIEAAIREYNDTPDVELI